MSEELEKPPCVWMTPPGETRQSRERLRKEKTGRGDEERSGTREGGIEEERCVWGGRDGAECGEREGRKEGRKNKRGGKGEGWVFFFVFLFFLLPFPPFPPLFFSPFLPSLPSLLSLFFSFFPCLALRLCFGLGLLPRASRSAGRYHSL